MLLDVWKISDVCSILVDWKNFSRMDVEGRFFLHSEDDGQRKSHLSSLLLWESSGAFLVVHFLCASLCTIRAISYVVGSMNG